MTISAHDLTLAEIAGLLERGEAGSRELTEACLARIEAVDPKVRAFLNVTAEKALAQADAADAARRGGAAGPLLGAPIALKDLFCTRGVATTCASRMLERFIPPYDATVVDRLRRAGAVFLGKLNMDEFAMGSSCEHSAFHPTHNPWDTARSPGGSSGGSAAAVAAGMCPATLGTDTGGSIRQPAAMCGVVGLKPTYGRVSRYGVVAFASSLDQVGTLTRTVADAAVLLQAIAGHDPLDSTSAPVETPDYAAGLGGDLDGLRIGLPEEYFAEGLDPQVEQAARAAVERLESLGATLVQVSLPHSRYAVPTYYIITSAEASSNLARYEGAHYGFREPGCENIIQMYARTRSRGFGEEAKRRIMLGTFALSAGFYDAYYLKAMRARTLFARDFERAFGQVDLIATPTSPTPAFKLGEKLHDPIQMYLNDLITIPVNLTGLPAISVPCGMADGKLPVGLQLIAPAFEEGRLLRAAHAYEQSESWWRNLPAPIR